MEMTMDNYILAILFFALGGVSIWYSSQKPYFRKTAEVQGVNLARRKFRTIKLCGYGLLIGGLVFALFGLLDI